MSTNYLSIALCTAILTISNDKPGASPATIDDEFSIAILPDTQYYCEESQGGTIEYFRAQTKWIMDNREKEHIAYVLQEGDVVDKGDLYPKQWENAWSAISTLEKPYPGHPYGIPYGIAVGNHDQSPSQFAVTGKTVNYNKYFGIAHFAGRPYYGGHYGNDNDSHYDLFTAAGRSFIVIHMEFDAFDEEQDRLNNWACDILDKYSDRMAILVSHYIIGFNKVAGTNKGGDAKFGKQGQRMFDRLKTRPNLFLMLCGHVGDNGEGYRKDFYAGHPIQTLLADYQSRPHGGNGLMRLITFSKKKDVMHVRTLSPYLGIEEEDDDSKFTIPWLHHPNASRIFDFNNDGRSAIALFNNGRWKIQAQSGTHQPSASLPGANQSNPPQSGASQPGIFQRDTLFGAPGDIPTPADFNNTGKADLSTYSPSTSTFHIAGQPDIQWGEPGDIPLPADYDGDGFAEPAVWRPSNSTWYIKGREPFKHGWKDAIPVPADYDGDGKTEPAVWRPSTHTWYIAELGNVPFGQPGDIPVPGDYTGDGKADIAVFRPTTGAWLLYGNNDSTVLGQPGDIPVPGDYFGEGRIHPAAYRPSTQTLYFYNGKSLHLEAKKDELLNLPYHIKRSYFE